MGDNGTAMVQRPPPRHRPAEPERSPAGARRSGLLDIVTPRRLVTVALLLLAGVLSVVGLQSVKDQRAATCGGGTVIQTLFPCPGDTALRQGRIGASLAQGWTLDLYVDNAPIPKDQLTVEGSDFYYTPGPGTETGALQPGRHTVRIVYYRDLADPATGSVYSWAFNSQ